MLTVIEEFVEPLLHNRSVPLVLNVEFPQSLLTVTTGANGTVFGADVPLPDGLTQPLTVCVTVYVALLLTVIDEFVEPLLHNRFVPLVLNVELPQLLFTVTTGADGIVFGDDVPLPGALVHPFTVCVTV